MKLPRRVNFALGTGVVLVLAFALAAFSTINAVLRDAQSERASQEAILLLERGVSQLRTAESWQRKYLITARPADLKAYQLAVAQVTHELARVQRAVAPRDGQRLMAALQETVGRRLANMETAVRLRQEAGLDAASAFIGSSANAELRQQIQALVERIKASEQAALLAAREDTEERAQLVKGLLVAGAALALTMLAWAGYLVYRFALQRQVAEARLARSVRKLEDVGGALRNSEAQLREVLDTVPVLFGYVDRRQRLLFHNRAYEASLGLRRGELLGRPIEEALGATMYQAVRHHIEEALAGRPVTYVRTQRDGVGAVREFEIQYFPRFGRGDESETVVGVYEMGRDVTEIRRLDRMKGEFVSTVSHELRTPLTSIRGSLGLIAGGAAGPLPATAQRLLGLAVANCERLVRLVNDILDIEKLEAGQVALDLQPQPLAPLLQRALAGNDGLAAQQGVALALEAPQEQAAAAVDADRFVQVATNLVSNAVRFAPAGDTVRVVLVGDGALQRVEVRDRGPGVPPKFQDRLFQRFAQADASSSREKAGTGLGLSIAKALVERMGGHIGYRRDAGETVFFVEFPAVTLEAELAEGAQSA